MTDDILQHYALNADKPDHQLKVIFLDIDGVIRTERQNEIQGGGMFADRPDNNNKFSDPRAIEKINDICEKTGAKIVFITNNFKRIQGESDELYEMRCQTGLDALAEEELVEWQGEGADRELVAIGGLKKEYFHEFPILRSTKPPSEHAHFDMSDDERGERIVSRVKHLGIKPYNIMIIDDNFPKGLDKYCETRLVQPESGVKGLSDEDYAKMDRLAHGRIHDHDACKDWPEYTGLGKDEVGEPLTDEPTVQADVEQNDGPVNNNDRNRSSGGGVGK